MSVKLLQRYEGPTENRLGELGSLYKYYYYYYYYYYLLLQRRVLQGLERIGLPVKNNLLAIPSAQIVELNIKFGTNKNKELHT